jgi:hypothetical protein
MNPYRDAVDAELDNLRNAAIELADAPTRLHLSDVQPRDLLGSPRIHPRFLAWLDKGVHATHTVKIVETCRMDHPIGAEPCSRCGDQGTYVIERDEWSRPFARALWISARRHSGLRPHPVTVVAALLSSGYRPTQAARLWGEDVVSADHLRTIEARCVSAIRSVMGHYERTIVPSPTIHAREAAIAV